jgi:formamidopyrimidine-DNA glycosylase
MPELPDVVVYVERIAAMCVGQPLVGAKVASPFVLRTTDPPLAEAVGRRVVEVRRIGKRIAIGLEAELFLVIHLMIAGRLRWRPVGTVAKGPLGLGREQPVTRSFAPRGPAAQGGARMA